MHIRVTRSFVIHFNIHFTPEVLAFGFIWDYASDDEGRKDFTLYVCIPFLFLITNIRNFEIILRKPKD